MSVVAITGVSGCLGRQLLMQMEVDDEVTAVVGLDWADPPEVESSKLTFVQQSIAEPFDGLFKEHGVDTAVHLAFTLNPDRDRTREEAVNLQGTQNFLAACGAAEVGAVCVASSATVYGAHADNPDVLYEGAPLRAKDTFPYASDKVKMEDLCYDWVKDHPNVALSIVRPCVILGPSTHNYLTRMLDRPVILAPWGRDPAFQFVHEDDATRAIYRLIKLAKVGVYNLTGDGALTLSQIAQLAERRLVQLPVFLMRFLAWLGWRLRLNWLSEVPPGFIDYCIHNWLIAGLKIKTDAYFLLRYDTANTFLDYLEHRSGVEPLGPPPPELDEDYDSGDELVLPDEFAVYDQGVDDYEDDEEEYEDEEGEEYEEEEEEIPVAEVVEQEGEQATAEVAEDAETEDRGEESGEGEEGTTEDPEADTESSESDETETGEERGDAEAQSRGERQDDSSVSAAQRLGVESAIGQAASEAETAAEPEEDREEEEETTENTENAEKEEEEEVATEDAEEQQPEVESEPEAEAEAEPEAKEESSPAGDA